MFIKGGFAMRTREFCEFGIGKVTERIGTAARQGGREKAKRKDSGNGHQTLRGTSGPPFHPLEAFALSKIESRFVGEMSLFR
jgi:hypothetical protein